MVGVSGRQPRMSALRCCRDGPALRRHFGTGARAQQAFDHDAVAGRQSRTDNPQSVGQRTGLDHLGTTVPSSDTVITTLRDWSVVTAASGSSSAECGAEAGRRSRPNCPGVILGVPITRVFEAMQVYIGSAYVNDFNILGRTYQVVAQADEPFRRDPHDIAQLKTRNSAGQMVPIGSVALFRDITGPYRVPRYDLYPAAEVQGATLPGYSSSYGIEMMERLAAERLPDGFSFEWTDLAYQQKLAGNTILLIFGASALFVFLVLAAQYESWTLPLAIILIVPMCLLAAVTGLLIRGMNIEILAQIGLVVLVGLAAKNAILIVEFAKQSEEGGATPLAAAIDAARTRLMSI